MQWNTPLEVIPVVPLERKYCSGRVVADDFNNAWLEVRQVQGGTAWTDVKGGTVGINYTANDTKTIEDAAAKRGAKLFYKR
jgi:hypothetical protein